LKKEYITIVNTIILNTGINNKGIINNKIRRCIAKINKTLPIPVKTLPKLLISSILPSLFKIINRTMPGVRNPAIIRLKIIVIYDPINTLAIDRITNTTLATIKANTTPI
jgi:hypothetical protein